MGGVVSSVTGDGRCACSCSGCVPGPSPQPGWRRQCSRSRACRSDGIRERPTGAAVRQPENQTGQIYFALERGARLLRTTAHTAAGRARCHAAVRVDVTATIISHTHPAQSRPKRSNMLPSLPQALGTPARPAGCCIANDQRPGWSSVLAFTIMQVRQRTECRLGESGRGGLNRINIGLRG